MLFPLVLFLFFSYFSFPFFLFYLISKVEMHGEPRRLEKERPTAGEKPHSSTTEYRGQPLDFPALSSSSDHLHHTDRHTGPPHHPSRRRDTALPALEERAPRLPRGEKGAW